MQLCNKVKNQYCFTFTYYNRHYDYFLYCYIVIYKIVLIKRKY